MKYYIESLGCAKNLVDSERFAAILEAYRFVRTEEVEEADLVLVNSCAFLIRSLGELDDTICDILSIIDRKRTKLVVTGCVMNRDYDEFKDMFPEVNKWVPLKDFEAFEKYLNRYVMPKGSPVVKTVPGKRSYLQGGQFAYLRIADGCDNYCSYCMIPSIRGKLTSETIETLVQEATKLTDKGRELVLIAQDTCMYGTDIYGRKALPELIAALHEIPGFDWIRVMYMHPDHFELEWTELWKKYPKLLPYFEIPIQHVKDNIIHDMNRQKGYTELKALFDHIRKEVPQAVFRTTLMVGYPGETKADRDLIRKFLKEVDILHAGVFGYSPEKEGEVYGLKPGFDWQKVEDYEISLAKWIAKEKETKMQRFVGTVQPALLEGYDPEMKAYIGRVWFQAPEIDGFVYIGGKPSMKHPVIQVEVLDALADEMVVEYLHPRKRK